MLTDFGQHTFFFFSMFEIVLIVVFGGLGLLLLGFLIIFALSKMMTIDLDRINDKEILETRMGSSALKVMRRGARRGIASKGEKMTPMKRVTKVSKKK